MERVHRIRDIIIEHTQLKKLVSFGYVENDLNCGRYTAEHTVKRTLQLYPDLKEVKLFDAYGYYYHSSFAEEDLKAALEKKRNYLRIAKGRDNRIGHNWEAVAEWFIDRFTTGARFWTQNHRTGGMDPRHITLHLIKDVGGRRNSAEVDRVWEVTPGIFAPAITYVLSCKWGLVTKRHVDDFLDVLRWSKEFRVDTPDGRDIKQGVVEVFAASAFNPRENVQLKDDSKISLAQYAARMRLQLLRASDFNRKLHERGCPRSVSVQKLCKRAKNEDEVRETLEKVWNQPEKAEDILNKLLEKNIELSKFEKILEETAKNPKLDPENTWRILNIFEPETACYRAFACPDLLCSSRLAYARSSIRFLKQSGQTVPRCRGFLDIGNFPDSAIDSVFFNSIFFSQSYL